MVNLPDKRPEPVAMNPVTLMHEALKVVHPAYRRVSTELGDPPRGLPPLAPEADQYVAEAFRALGIDGEG